MRPVTTFIRHKGIAAVLSAARLLNKLTGGRHPAFLFSAHTDLSRVGSSVRILEETKTSVTIAKVRPDGSVYDGEFRIMTATDMHLDPGDAARNNKSIDLFVRQIREEKPDLVILTGDVILSDCQQIDAVQFSQMMEKLGVYWAYVFGNHEAREEKEYFKYLLYKGLMSCPHCLCRFGDPSLFGYGNFAIHIKNGENSLLKSLFLFDSGRDIQEKSRKEYGLPETASGYDFIKRTQTEWYLRELARVKEKYVDVRTVTYMHIPVPEYRNVFSGSEQEGFIPSGKAKLLYGTQYESIGCSCYNSGFFDAAKEEGSLQAMFSGHDHVNDFCAEFEGVFLVYTQCTGYNTYSMTDKQGWNEKDCHYGVTLTTLLPDGTLRIEGKKNARFV